MVRIQKGIEESSLPREKIVPINLVHKALGYLDLRSKSAIRSVNHESILTVTLLLTARIKRPLIYHFSNDAINMGGNISQQ